MRTLLIVCLSLLLLTPAFAEEAKSVAADPVLERHVVALTEELRCLVCQNQTIADSHADLAIDLKNQVRDQLAHGKSDKEVLNYMVERYGDFVLYRPPVKATTWLLWFGPFLLLVGGILFLLIKLRTRKTHTASESLSEADHLRASNLLDPSSTTAFDALHPAGRKDNP